MAIYNKTAEATLFYFGSFVIVKQQGSRVPTRIFNAMVGEVLIIILFLFFYGKNINTYQSSPS